MNADSKNPFSDQFNPYQPPTWQASAGPLAVLTRDQARLRLLGPAIGLSVTAVLWICYVGFALCMVALEGPQPPRRDAASVAESVGQVVGMILGAAIFMAPSLIVLAGAVQMFRVKGYAWAMAGAIAGSLPCTFCFPLAIPFGIWGIVVLYDHRVHAAFQATGDNPFRRM